MIECGKEIPIKKGEEIKMRFKSDAKNSNVAYEIELLKVGQK